MTKIEWTHQPGTTGESWNPIRARNKQTGGVGHFCVKVSDGCLNCYAATFQKRLKNPVRYAQQDRDAVEIFLDDDKLLQPLRWKKPCTIFVCSMTDLFYEGHDDEWIDSVFAVAALCQQHTFIILTKRINKANAYFQKHFTRHKCGHIAARLTGKLHPGGHDCDPDVCNMQFPLPNVWLGVSVEDQKAAEERIPVLLDTPAAVRFLSVEPLLGPVNLVELTGRSSDQHDTLNSLTGKGKGKPTGSVGGGRSSIHLPSIDWVIVGGESGHNARPMHPDWARLLRDQCKATETAFFFKQWGAWMPQIGAKNDISDNSEISKYIWKEWDPDQGQWEDWPYPMWCDDMDPDHSVIKVGKKAAGRSLDGHEHTEWPEKAA